MQILTLSNTLSVGSELTIQDFREIAQLGFKSVINLRRDYESDWYHPTQHQIHASATKAGLTAYHMPMKPGKPSYVQVEHFGELLERIEHPVLAVCRTGIRPMKLWILMGTNSADREARANQCKRAIWLSKSQLRGLNLCFNPESQ